MASPGPAQDATTGRGKSLRRGFNLACLNCRRRKIRCVPISGSDCTQCARQQLKCEHGSEQYHLLAAETRSRRHSSRSDRASSERLETNRTHASHRDTMAGRRPSAAERPMSSQNEHVRHVSRGSSEFRIPSTPASAIRTVPETLHVNSVPADRENPEDLEFDESQDFDNTLDGMGCLVAEPQKSGYMGPHSGISAMKLLRTLQRLQPSGLDASPDALREPDLAPPTSTDLSRYVDDYFAMYHPTYPILHEGTFRARVAGALPKPRDGSWLVLYNIVLALGAFVGDTQSSKADIPLYRRARENLSMDVLERGSLSYVQALGLMANYLQKRNKPNAAFVLVGMGWSMALAIGLHREFELPSTTPFIQEVRRRTWWTIFVFVSSAQLTLGRPPVSLVGINVRLPTNVHDQDLAVDTEELPPAHPGPTVTSCLIEQVNLAKIANMIQVELLTFQVPSIDAAIELDNKICDWRRDLPLEFTTEHPQYLRFELQRGIVIGRAFYLQIVLARPILFQQITTEGKLDLAVQPVKSCIDAAGNCVTFIWEHLNTVSIMPRGFAWYATHYLVTASFVQAACYMYCQSHPASADWRRQLEQTIELLARLGVIHDVALRGRDVLQTLLQHKDAHTSRRASISGTGPDEVAPSADNRRITFGSHNAAFGFGQNMQGPELATFLADPDFGLGRYAQSTSNAELLDAAGGFMLRNQLDSSTFQFDLGF